MKILISAPYMLREREKVQGLLNDFPQWNITWADVKERLEEKDLLKMIKDYDGVICGDDRFTEKVYQQAEKLKVVVKWGTGIDSLNQKAAEEKGITLCRTPDAFTRPVADTTLAYILAFARGIRRNDSILKQGGWSKPQGYALYEKKVGLIGFGNIGRAVAKRLLAFDCEVLVYDIVEIPKSIQGEYNVRVVEKAQIFSECDFISLHCDLNEKSEKTLDQLAFSQMKQCPYIINTARGPLIDERELIRAINDGRVQGAGLDVFEEEPLALDSPLRKMDQVFLASHNSNSSPKCWEHVHRNSIKMLAESLKVRAGL